MKSGFLTPRGNIEIAREDMLAFAKDYCNSLKSTELDNFRRSYQYVSADYEFLIRVLKWIQVGTVAFGQNTCIMDDQKSLAIYDCNSDDYFEIKKKETKKILKIEYINTLRFQNQREYLAIKSGFVLRDGTLVSFKQEKYAEMSDILTNYLSLNNKIVNEVLSHYDISRFEELLISLFGFIKVGVYGDIKILEYVKELENETFEELIPIYEKSGFKVYKYKALDKSASKDLLNLRM